MINVALLGFGNVGRAFARQVAAGGDWGKVRIQAIADISGGLILKEPETVSRALEKPLVRDNSGLGRFMDVSAFIDALPQAGVSVVVECTPTNIADGRPALDLILRILEHGISVVTVDKGPIVHGFAELAATAKRHGAAIAYGGTTGVRAPAELKGKRVIGIRGILNGTTNYILTEMLERGLDFAQALAKAQSLGIAEPDPRLDVEGWDTACKILILANEWMQAGAKLEDVARSGIGAETESLVEAARATKKAVRLVGRAEAAGGRVAIGVKAETLGSGSPFFSVSGTSKAAFFATEDGLEYAAASRSGRDAISRTILEDILKVTPPS